ncbi:MAG: hypothetical protein OHK0022_60830 [Roseiflexaceae bacterium]
MVIAARNNQQAKLPTLWPMLALLAAEVLAAVWLAPPEVWVLGPGVLAAGAVLLIGGLPALLRPSPASNLAGCIVVVLAGVLWRTPQTLGTVASFDQLVQALDAGDIRLSLLNIVLLAPLTLHLAARFPLPASLPGRWIAGYYLLVLAAAGATFALAQPWRQGALALLFASTYTGFALAGYQFLRTIQRVRPTEPRAAQQARLLLLTLFLAQLPFLLLPVSMFIRLLIPYQLVIGAQILLPLGVVYTLLRQDLFGIDAALRRTLDYALVSFGLLVIYFGLAALLTQLSRDLGGTWGFAATILSVLAAAAAFTPLRNTTQRAVDRVFYPERLYFGQTIAAARATLAQVVQREAVVQLLEHDLPQQLGAAWGRLVLRPAFDHPPGADERGVWSMLLTVGGQPIGCYWLGPRRSGLRYAPDEQEQLQGLTQQAALALAYAETFDRLVQLNNELEERVAIRSEHVVAQQRELAAFEERQRLARDLHDSVKQTLFSLGIGLRAARNRVRNDPDAAIQLLEQQEQSAIQAQTELGDLLGHLRTPATGTADLAVTLAQQVAWFAQQHGLSVTQRLEPALVLAEPLPRELTQIAREALLNVVRHSGAAQATLTLGVERGVLLLGVQDQGRGFDQAAQHSGHGLRSMRERVALLGGTLRIASEPGKGTAVWIRVPLENQTPQQAG